MRKSAPASWRPVPPPEPASKPRTRRRFSRPTCARWSQQADSQSAHVHLSLKGADGTLLFPDASKPGNMSDTFRHFIGGLGRYAGEMMLLFAPTVNSCRRFAPGTVAPPVLTWEMENRTPCLRVVGHDAAFLRVETALPDQIRTPT